MGVKGGFSDERVVGWGFDSDFSQLDRRPGAPTCEGQVGVDHGQFPGALHPDHILVMEIVYKDSKAWVVEGEIAVIDNAVVSKLHGIESDLSHQGPRFPSRYGGRSVSTETWRWEMRGAICRLRALRVNPSRR